MTSTRRHLTAAGAVVLIALPLAACNNDPDPTTAPSPTSETGSATPTTSSTPTVSPTAPDQIAYAEAERVYRAFIANYTGAVKAWEPGKLDQKLITPALYQFFVKDFSRFSKDKAAGTTDRFTQVVKSVAPAKFVTGKEAQIRVCATTNNRYIDKAGADITKSSIGGPKAPINTRARSNNVQVVSTDGGKTWRLNFFALTSGEGTPC